MTRIEAIDLLDTLIGMIEDNHDSDYDTALDMAIKALEQEPCEDAISRQAVLDYIYNDLGLGDEENGKDLERQMDLVVSYKYVKSLPPVKPQICEDTISRQAALDMLEDINAETEGVGFYYEHYVDYVKSLPSVKPQEPTGHWIDYDSNEDKYDKIKCSECGHSFIVDSYHWCDIGFTEDDLKYCPNCGCAMFEPQESEEV